MTALHVSPLPTRPARPGSLAATLDGAVLTFPGIDAQWPTKLQAILTGRPWLTDWVEEVLAQARDFSTQPRLRATGWSLAEHLHTDCDPEWAATAPLLLAGTVLTSLASLTALEAEGLAEVVGHPNTVVTGHSAGLLSAAAAAGGLSAAAQALKLALAMGVTATQAARQMSALPTPGSQQTPMAAVSGVSTARLRELLLDGVELALINAPGRHVLSGRPADLDRQRQLLESLSTSEAAARKLGQLPGAPLTVVWEPVTAPVPFHHSGLTSAVESLADWDLRLTPTLLCIDPATGQPLTGTDALARSVLAAPQDWAGTLRSVTHETVIAIGGNGAVEALTRESLEGCGTLFIPADTAQGHAGLFTPGAQLPRTSNYAQFAPTQHNGELVNRHTRLSGRSPFVLAGMTPTTVDAGIVAAAANAGHVAELAGGGQVSEAIFTERMTELAELLDPGTEVVFNALHLDPYLWDLHLGAQRLVQKARAAGAPICGVTISAGIPAREEALALLDELNGLGIWLNALKPGTQHQIKAALEIAQGTKHPLWLHVEGGQAGGHHSWEDLESLLLDTYAAIRQHDNVVLAVGGGVGTPQRADELLTGTWSRKYGRPDMPVDAILLGTVAMACQESTASASVKAALAAAGGPDSGWVRRAKFDAGMTSGLSGLGADIHFLDNTTSRTAALLDTVAGDADAVQGRRDEIIDALSGTAKPYFGDVDQMSYAQVLERFVELTAVGDHGRYQDGVWLDPTHRQRFAYLVERTQARLHPLDEGQFRPLECDTDDPWATLATLRSYPLDTRLHPADADYFLAVCRRPGKPVPFVPVIDADVRRWYASDALWQSHDDRYDADQVLIIPGPAAINGITHTDEPVAQLFARFAAGCLDNAGPSTADPVLTRVLRAPVVRWAGQTRPNPLQRIGEWEVGDVAVWTSGQEYARLTPISDNEVELELGWEPLTEDDGLIKLTFEVTSGAVAVRGLDRVRIPTAAPIEHPEQAHATLLGSAHVLPDAAMRSMWPAVFAAISTAAPSALLDLVHARHSMHRDDAAQTAHISAKIGAPGGYLLTTRAGDGTWTTTDQFFIRQRGHAASAPVATPAQWHDTPHLLLGEVQCSAPDDLQAFAIVTADLNPIHRSEALARFAGLPGRIVHGMWTSATGQRVVIDTACDGHPERLLAWEIDFTAPVTPGATVTFTSTRTGVRDGRSRVEVLAYADGDLVAAATATVAPARTAYVFPGQGIQHVGMGMGDYAEHPAAREVWDRADAHCRAALGFSILEVVRDNPTSLQAGLPGDPDAGVEYRHPAGVLFLTQFTQVAMATLASAQVAQLRAAGVFDEDAYCAGHSVGEYNALAAVTGTLALEDLLELVFARGTAMHHLVARDEAGASDFRLAVIRPHLAGLDHAGAQALVDDIARDTGQLCQIVNHNLRGKQYAVAGTRAALAALDKALGSGRSGKPALLYVPGIDVPFHSSALSAGVAGFRTQLEHRLPQTIDPARLVGRYIPNLYPEPFDITKDYLTRVHQVCDSPVLADLLATWGQHEPAQIARTLLVELLAHQFAMPVRWIETTDVLCEQIQVSRIVEVGVGAAPTLTNLTKAALALPTHTGSRPDVLNLEGDADEVFARTRTPEPVVESDSAPQAAEVSAMDAPQAPAMVAASPLQVADLPVTHADALRALVAIRVGVCPDQLDGTIEDLVDGASSRRNQVLMDLGKEFGISGIDGVQDLPLADVADAVSGKASGYRYPGPVLAAWLEADVATALHRCGTSSAAVAKRVADHWGLGEGWVRQTQLAIGLGTRQGASKRGGALSTLEDRGEALIDAAVQQVATTHNVTVSPVSQAQVTTIDSAAVAALEQRFEEVLTTAAIGILTGLRPAQEPDSDPHQTEQLDRLADLDAEHGASRAAAVRGVFDPRRHWHLASAGAWARASVDHLVHDTARGLTRPDLLDQIAAHRDSDPRIAATLAWYASSADQFGDAAAAVRDVVTEAQQRPAAGVETDLPSDAVPPQLTAACRRLVAGGAFTGQIALVTGASPGSIAEQTVAHLLRGGATVILATSTDNAERIEFYRELERAHSSPGASLHVVRANLASFTDIDRLLEWLTTTTTSTTGPVTREVKPALWPTLLLPFAAAPATGSLADTGPDNEVTARLLSLGVQRLIGRLGERILAAGRDPVTVVLPLSPNHGTFGGDGSYGDSKAALETVLNRWHAEQAAWAAGTRLIGAEIGWVRGTGLMAANDGVADAVESALGVRTYTAAQMGALIAAMCTLPVEGPVRIDVTGGLSQATGIAPVLGELAGHASMEQPDAPTIGALPAPPWPPSPAAIEVSPSIDLEDMVVIAGISEIGPWGGSGTRWQAEVGDLNADAVTELAWRMGLITWDAQAACWRDSDGESLDEAAVASTLRDTVSAHVGIRLFEPTADVSADGSVTLVEVYLDKPVTVGGHTYPEGTAIRVPATRPLQRQVGGQFPTGIDPVRHGVEQGIAHSIDPLAAWNLVVTAEALASAGITPDDLGRAVHASRIGNVQGTGMGGMNSLHKLYVDPLLGSAHANDLLQEALGNVVSAHVNQSLLGGYGPMVHPVAACATAAVSLEEAVDKIRLGKADILVAGGLDDLSTEGINGFADMAATADNAELLASGIPAHWHSRPGDMRRAGFVESQGGASMLVVRGSVAARLGLPVRAVVAYAGSFGDGVQTSIPAPGLGTLAAARGGPDSPLASALRAHGLTVDDIAVVSKHDTSTLANDPNEALIHATISEALGRTPGNPLRVVSQKSVTGHAKGGAAGWQIAGLCDVFATSTIPGNRPLVSVDEQVTPAPLVVDYRPLQRATPVRAAVVTSLGFGHVSALVALAHPGVFEAALAESERAGYRHRSAQRRLDGAWTLLAARYCRAPVFNRRTERRDKQDEIDYLMGEH